MSRPIRIFVGCAAKHEDAESQAVLEWTLMKNHKDHENRPLAITWMKQSDDPLSFWHGWNTERWATPFSGFRWGIPAACNYEGRAIYMDSDVIVHADIQELHDAPLPAGKVVMAKPGSWRLCVSMWDCAAAKPYMLPIDQMRADPEQHKKMNGVFKQPALMQGFLVGHNWNCLDGEDKSLFDPTTKAIHYTAMANQPHLAKAIPRLAAAGGKHWFDGNVAPHWRPELIQHFNALLEEAAMHGYSVARYCADPVLKGEYRKKSLVNYKAGPRH